MEDDLNPSQLSTRLQEIVSSFISLSTHVEERIESLREKENHLEETKKKIKESITKVDNQIDLNVGGMRLSASKSTLVSIEGSYFYVMLSSDRWKPNNKGEYFIDRDFTHFPRILNYLRTGELELDGLNEIDMKKLNKELDYYQMPHQLQSLKWDPKRKGEKSFVHPIEPLQWDLDQKGMAITLSDAGRIAKCTGGPGAVLATRPVSSFSIKILSFQRGFSLGIFYLGLVSQSLNPDKDNLESSGWCLSLNMKKLYSQVGDKDRPYGKDFKIGDTITMHHNKRNKTIGFSVNEKFQGVAFFDVPSDVELYPSVRLGPTCSVEIVD